MDLIYTLDQGPCNPDEDVVVEFLVKTHNKDKLDQLFKERNDPNHPDYGKFLSAEEMNALTGPSEDEITSVQQALEKHTELANPEGTPFTNRTGRGVQVKAKAHQIEKLIKCPIHWFKTKEPKAPKEYIVKHKPGTEYEIPSDIAQWCDAMNGLG